MKKHLLTYLTICFLTTSCYSQNNNASDVAFKKTDIALHQMYQEYYKDRLDYGHEKDSLLPLFEHNLKETLSKKEFYGMSFDSLTKTKQVSVITSEDKKLRIYSWNTFNMGSWKIYNSLYQYGNNDQIYTDFLSEKDENNPSYINFSDGYHYKIYTVDANTYLIEGYGTHGHGHEFHTLRLLKMNTNTFGSIKGSFNGENQLVVIKARGKENPITYLPKTKEIKYSEYLEDENTGFIKPTGKTTTLIYTTTNGRFMKKE